MPRDESFDHVIRHAELEEKLEYVRQNPVKRGSWNIRIAISGCLIRSITG